MRHDVKDASLQLLVCVEVLLTSLQVNFRERFEKFPSFKAKGMTIKWCRFVFSVRSDDDLQDLLQQASLLGARIQE